MTSTSLKTMKTLALVAALLVSPIGGNARAFAGGVDEQSAGTAAIPVEEYRCMASAARSEMVYFQCLTSCARRASADASCAQSCSDRREARDARLSCVVPSVPEAPGGAGLATPQAARKKGPCTRMYC